MVKTKIPEKTAEDLLWKISTDGVLLCTDSLEILRVSDSLKTLVRCGPDPDIEEILRPGSAKKMGRKLQEIEESSGELPLLLDLQLNRNSRRPWTEWQITPLVPDHEEAPRTFLCVIRDISKRKRAEQKLKEKNLRKELLIRETLHRVKNNFHMISSLINLQKYETENPEVREVLGCLNNRIYSMTLIHDELHGSDLRKIQLNSYLEDLIRHISQSFLPPESPISIELNLQETTLSSKKTVPIGLIVNEILINAIKYAFPGNRGGTISVDCRRTNHKLLLKISDDGVGFPENWKPGTKKSLGQDLIQALSQQLKARVHHHSSRGTTYLFEIPV